MRKNLVFKGQKPYTYLEIHLLNNIVGCGNRILSRIISRVSITLQIVDIEIAN